MKNFAQAHCTVRGNRQSTIKQYTIGDACTINQVVTVYRIQRKLDNKV